jgi:hypothetical protein
MGFDVRGFRRRNKLWFSALIVLVVALVALRFFLPGIVRDQINANVDTMGEYHGEVADVDLHIWRGAYSLHGFVIEKKTGEVPVPLLNAPRIDLSVSWREIFHGGIVAEVEFGNPELNFVDGRTEADSQTGRGVDWRQQLEALLPIKLNEVRVVDGTLFFHNFISSPPVDLKATNTNATVYNLTNVRDADGNRVARFEGRAEILGEAPLETAASFDPFGKMEDFTFDLKVTDVELTKLNPLFQAYAKLDAASGNGDFVVQMKAENGRLSGYAKPIMQNVEIASWEQDVEQQGDNPLRVAWETTAGFVQSLFKNQPEDQLATKVEFAGTLDNPKTSTLDTLLHILRNAFVEAYKPQFEEARETKPKND